MIEWTDRTTEMYTIAESTAGVPELISWYTEDGGPLLNPAMHGGDELGPPAHALRHGPGWADDERCRRLG